MDRIKGKLRSGQRAYVELKDGSVNVTVERGLIMNDVRCGRCRGSTYRSNYPAIAYTTSYIVSMCVGTDITDL